MELKASLVVTVFLSSCVYGGIVNPMSDVGSAGSVEIAGDAGFMTDGFDESAFGPTISQPLSAGVTWSELKASASLFNNITLVADDDALAGVNLVWASQSGDDATVRNVWSDLWSVTTFQIDAPGVYRFWGYTNSRIPSSALSQEQLERFVSVSSITLSRNEAPIATHGGASLGFQSFDAELLLQPGTYSIDTFTGANLDQDLYPSGDPMITSLSWNLQVVPTPAPLALAAVCMGLSLRRRRETSSL